MYWVYLEFGVIPPLVCCRFLLQVVIRVVAAASVAFDLVLDDLSAAARPLVPPTSIHPTMLPC